MPMLVQEMIALKSQGHELGLDAIRTFIARATANSIPDYQISAMLMAVCLNGLTDRELVQWTNAVAESGDIVTFPDVSRALVDKHSTGGVGDKTSLSLAPAVAACGLAVPMSTVRSHGYSGGTLDRLRSIPGLDVSLPVEELRAIVGDIGVAIVGETGRLAPAERVLFSLRDATASLRSIPLTAASIIAQKVAAGAEAVVLDCKIGRATIVRTMKEAEEFCRAVRVIGKARELPVCVVFTSMDEPIGSMVGNALEVAEAIDVLKGEGPADVRDLTVALGAEMLHIGGLVHDVDVGRSRIARALDDGSALEVFRRMIERQGGDPRVCDDPWSVLPAARHRVPVPSSRTGMVGAVDSVQIGEASLELGGARRHRDDDIDSAVGIELAVRCGDTVDEGQPLAYVHHNGRGVAEAISRIHGAFTLAAPSDAADASSRVIEILS